MFLTGPYLWIEPIYSVIIILFSLFIYLRTKEIYELTYYKGIKYFRNAFLFFGIALVEAFQKQNWLGALLFILLGIVFIWAENRKN